MDCKNWRHKPATDRTWANFKIFFVEVFNEARYHSLTAQTSGKAANVRQLQENEVKMSEMQLEMATVLANLVTATKYDRTAFIILTTTNDNLARQITTLTAQFFTAQGKILL